MFSKTSRLASALVVLAVYACAPDYDLLTAGSKATAGTGGKGGAVGEAGSGLTGGGDAGHQDMPGAGRGGMAATGGHPSGGSGGTPNAGSDSLGGAGTGANGGAGAAGVAGTSGSAGSGGNAGTAGNAGNAGNGGVVEPACAVAGKAFRFDNTSFADAVRVIQDDFTIEAWLKTTASPSGQYFWQGNPIAWADSSLAGSRDFGMSILNTQLYVNTGEPDISTFSTSVISTGQWTHMAVTRRKSTGVTQIFINGILERSNGGNTATLDTVATLSIGCTPNRDLFFYGLMDEMRLWTIVRTASDINATMHQRLSGSEAGLISYYRFDQLNGNKIPDLSGHGNDATAYGTNYTGALLTSNAPVCDPVASGGSGGASGNGGASGSAGAAGNGGASGSAGNAGSGGASGSGGTAGSAGTAGSGGVAGS